MATLDELKKLEPSTINKDNVGEVVKNLKIADFDAEEQIDGLTEDALTVFSLYDAIVEAFAESDADHVELKRQYVSLEKENVKLQQGLGPETSKALVDQELEQRTQAERVEDLENRLQASENENRRLQKEVADFSENKQTLETKLKNVEDERDDATRERQKFQDRVNLLESKNVSRDMVEQRDKDLRFLKSTLAALEAKNRELEDEVQKCKDELERGAADMDRFFLEKGAIQGRMEELENEYQQKSRETDAQTKLVEELQNEVDMLRRQDDNVMAALNEKVEEWKGIVMDKDLEIQDLSRRNHQISLQLSEVSTRADVKLMENYKKEIEEKENRISDLEQELRDGEREMNEIRQQLDDYHSELNKTGQGPLQRQADRIRQLMAQKDLSDEQMKQMKDALTSMEDRLAAVERDNDDLSKMNADVVSGVYGLDSAVREIQEKKRQLQRQDETIEHYVAEMNNMGEKIAVYENENEHMRERLGIGPNDPIDTEGVQRRREVKRQEDEAMVAALNREIERLEEDNRSYKWQVRELAKQTGAQAGNLGLSGGMLVKESFFVADQRMRAGMSEMGQMDEFNLPTNRTQTTAFQGGMMSMPHTARSGIGNEGFQMQLREVNNQMKDNLGILEAQNQNVDRLEAENIQLKNQNETMASALIEIKERIETSRGSRVGQGPGIIECPTLEKFLALRDSEKVLGDMNVNIYLKTRLDNLQGRYDEVRKELHEARTETTLHKIDLEKSLVKCKRLEDDLNMLKNFNTASKGILSINLPENMHQSSAEIINSLTDQLVIVLNDIDIKKDSLSRLEKSLDKYKVKYSTLRHRQSLLYADFLKERQQWENESHAKDERYKKVECLREQDQAKLTELDRLLDTLDKDPDEMKRRLAELTRHITVLRCKERDLNRTTAALYDIEKNIRRENARLKNDIMDMEKVVTERMSYYKRYKEMAAFKTSALQKALEECVPKDNLEKLQRKFDELTEKYRDFLEKNNSLVNKSELFDQLETEVKQMKLDNDALKRELTVEKEKRHLIEASVEGMNLNKQGSKGGSVDSYGSEQLVTVSKKIATLEMKELNERQRADHASRIYENLKINMHEVENRNKELEDKFAEMSRITLEAQKTERELRDALSTCVTKEVSDKDRAKIDKLEETELKLKQEVEKLKEIADIALSQARNVKEQQVCQEKELKSLRQQLLDLQSHSDLNSQIGKLQRQILQLHFSETTALRKLEEERSKVKRMEAQLLRLEYRIDEKDDNIYHHRLESRSKSKQLKDTINSLRSQFAGCVPLSKQERFTKTLLSLQEEKLKVKHSLDEAEVQRIKAEDDLLSMKVKHEGLVELLDTLKEGRGAQKVADWHQKMEQLRLDELKQKRQVERLRQQIKHLEIVIRSQEAQIAQLEEENVSSNKEFEERQFVWEQRESEYERMIQRMEKAGSEITGTARRLEDATSDMPNVDLPLPTQLDHAITTIKKKIKLIFDLELENKKLKVQHKELEEQLKEKERTLIKRERYINELRLRLPATTDRDKIFSTASDAAQKSVNSASPGNYVEAKTIEVAQATVESLQARLQQKEESLTKYKEMLKGCQEDLEAAVKRHQDETKILRTRLNQKDDENLRKMQDKMAELEGKPKQSLTQKHLMRLHELEEILAQQGSRMDDLTNQLHDAQRGAEEWEVRYEHALKSMDAERNMIQQDVQAEKERMNQELKDARRIAADKQQEIELLKEEVHFHKSENSKSPSVVMKNLVKKLENQLDEKEKQQRALSKALTDLRGDMVRQAEETSKITINHQGQEQDLHKILEKHTKDIADELEMAKERLGKSKAEMRKYREEKEAAEQVSEELKADIARKEAQINRIRSDKNKLEQDYDELDKKLERFKNMRRTAPDEMTKAEMDDLKRKNRILEEEIRRYKLRAEKPFEEEAIISSRVSKTATAKGLDDWEEKKKLEKMVEKWKEKYNLKSIDQERLQRQLDLTKNALDRTTKEKDALVNKLTRKSATLGPMDYHQVSVTPIKGHRLQVADSDVRERNFQLEDENSKLRNQLHRITRDNDKEGIGFRNQMLEDRVEDLERQLRLEKPEFSIELERLKEREKSFQQKMQDLQRENTDLSFEVDQSRRDLPRLKDRVNHLTKHVELLKEEKAQLEAAIGGTARSTASSLGSIKRVGESGKSTKELEETIGKLQKVIRRLQSENERLKAAPGVVNADKLQQVKQENEKLQQEVADLKDNMGAKLADRYDAKEKGAARLMAEHDKVRRELQKENDAHNKTRAEVARLERMLSEGRFPPAPDLTEKISDLESQLSKKDKVISTLQNQMAEAAERERNWRVEQQMLVTRRSTDAQ